jgi:hypothetical protein
MKMRGKDDCSVRPREICSGFSHSEIMPSNRRGKNSIYLGLCFLLLDNVNSVIYALGSHIEEGIQNSDWLAL